MHAGMASLSNEFDDGTDPNAYFDLNLTDNDGKDGTEHSEQQHDDNGGKDGEQQNNNNDGKDGKQQIFWIQD